MKTALQRLTKLDLESRQAAHPDVPAFAIVKRKFSDATANGLTRAIVRCFELHYPFATRVASTGSYRADLKQFIASQQRAGIPDVFAVIEGHAVFVEVKIGRDRLSNVQKETIAALISSGATVYCAHTFEGFWSFFETYVLTIPKAPISLYNQRHRIPNLATPDLPKLNQ